MLNFFEMEMKFGPVAAFYCLCEIEKAAHISSYDVCETDPETRLQNACKMQDELRAKTSVAA